MRANNGGQMRVPVLDGVALDGVALTEQPVWHILQCVCPAEGPRARARRCGENPEFGRRVSVVDVEKCHWPCVGALHEAIALHVDARALNGAWGRPHRWRVRTGDRRGKDCGEQQIPHGPSSFALMGNPGAALSLTGSSGSRDCGVFSSQAIGAMNVEMNVNSHASGGVTPGGHSQSYKRA